MAASDVEHWQSDKTLPQCMAYILDNQIMCDVTFLLGEERLEVHAHKYMLASRSAVFHAMFEGPMAERGTIEIPDIEKDIFKMFLRYIYTDDVTLTLENATQVMYASKKYCVDLLTTQCKDFLQTNINNENVCLLIDSVLLIQEEELYTLCLEKIKYNPLKCIRGPGFSSISWDTLKIITELEDVIIKEEVLYEHVMKWCEAECGRQQLDITWENKRKLLGDILYNIRFPLMDSKYFAKEMVERDLLTEKEKVAIMYYHLLRTQVTSCPFNFTERCSGTIESVIRFSTHSRLGWSLGGWTDAIGFETSHDSVLYGILLYGSILSCNYAIEITVTDSSGLIQSTTKTEIASNKETEMHEIMFENPVKIEAQKSFRVELMMTGSDSRRGEGGKCNVQFANGTKEVTFFNSEPSPNLTNVECGQIPGLLLM